MHVKLEQTVNVDAGPQREIFPGGTKVDAGPPNLFQKLGEDQTKKVFTEV